jgi:ubiquinone/menaquinone biosynthesis C-methylase UbiE
MPYTNVHEAERPAVSQFGLPRGLAGRLAGAVMAVENRTANRLVVDTLDPGSEDFVLEVGCGPGVALAQLAERARFAAGVDPSDVMVAQAQRRLRRAVASGRAEVCRAEAAWLPYDDDFFTSALALHTIHHWACVKAGLHELHRVVAPGGRVVLAERLARPGRDPHARGFSEADAAAFEEQLARSGFTGIARADHRLPRETLAIYTAQA